MLICGALGGQALVLSQKVCRELCQQPGAVEKVHARVHVRRNRRSTRPLHGHLIKTTCGGLHRYCDCNFASQWPFTISCTVAYVSGATHAPSGLGLFHFYLWSKSSFIQDVCLRFITWHEIAYSPLNHSSPSPRPPKKPGWKKPTGFVGLEKEKKRIERCLLGRSDSARYSNSRCHSRLVHRHLNKLSHLWSPNCL